MTQLELIEDAAKRAANRGATFGLGGQAAAQWYRENKPNEEELLYTIAVMANDLWAAKETARRKVKA